MKKCKHDGEKDAGVERVVSCPTVDDEMLTRAMNKAVDLGIFKRWVGLEAYKKHWGEMKEVLQAAVGN